jgi:hypothetical protein
MTLTIKDCHCGNCTKDDCKLSNMSLERAKPFKILSVGKIMLMRSTTECFGCASHPLAREALMADVVEELREFVKTHQDDGSCPFDSMNEGDCHKYGPDEEHEGGCSLCVFDHAIEAIIRNGGGK